MSDVLFYKDQSGKKNDTELHEELLKSHELNWTDSIAQLRAIQFGVDHLGLSLEVAKCAYS